ncbi:MAG: hypothetical protein MJH10_15245 [Epibacterium sp.]|nr:hypothetical protein [Epibacterium sp.]NQX74875.1 hypothetical protein [Epibacterium sp.]
MTEVSDQTHEDADTRKFALTIVDGMADRMAAFGMLFESVAEYIAAAQLIEHYINDGQDVTFVCSTTDIEKFVRPIVGDNQ